MPETYHHNWCYNQNDHEDNCTAPIIHGVPLCHHEQPSQELHAL